MKHFIFAYSLFASLLFFSFSAIFGYNYAGDTVSSTYRYYCIITFIIVLFTFIMNYSKQIIASNNLPVFLIAIVYLLAGLISGFWTDKSYLCLVAFCIPAICVGVYYGNKGGIDDIVKWLDVFLWIITIALLFLSIKLSVSMSLGYIYYSQTLSYNAAMAFLLDLYLLAYGKKYPRFQIFKSRLFKILSFVFLPIYLVIILFSGGRGGFVTMIMGLIIYIFTSSRKKTRGNVILGVFLLLMIYGSFLLINRVGSIDFQSSLQKNGMRVFSYVTSEGIDMTETSGRDFVYKKTIQLAEEHPFGCGLFSYKKVFQPVVGQPYPHNLFLEWLIQGGVVFLLLWSVIVFLVFRKYHRMWKKGQDVPLLLPFIVFPMTLLMFSGSYMEEPLFWFSLSFLFVIKPNSCKNRQSIQGGLAD